ncbi:serine/threonine-protein kinase [Crateriforma spongiae]|uniref:serine/threonine-protein kinase n=1 Tax=Crateriforma spongiae TaxID=2724528 RepID=UPI001F2CA8A2|nr:serine/threonine-protein kinase [Crateriforma spongiae]
MTDDHTLDQTPLARSASKRLSMQATTPPAEVPGYRLIKFLGSGAFGQVWVGRDLNTGRGVAVKFYLHRGGVNWSLLSREVKNLVQLSANRHVVQVLEVGWDADPPYYVMELITGGSLEEMLKSRGRLPVEEAVEIFRKICVGLNHCHSKGVLHCDVKPANILMGDDQEPRLADFGQSRMSHDQTPALGTLFYMAPEQADLDANPDASWDVYAAGAILFQMLVGKPPYRDESLISRIDTAGSLPKRLRQYQQAIASQPPVMERLARSGIDRPLQRILAKSLANDPEDRYRNVQQILADLQERENNRARRPLLLLGIVGPLLLLAATSIFAARSINRASESTTEALRTEAFGSNQLAARFAAKTLQSEIERYFALAIEEAKRPEFQQTLREFLTDPEIKRQRERIATADGNDAGNMRVDAREQIYDAPKRVALDEYLYQRLGNHVGEDARRPLATMFVTDRFGTIVAIAYDNPVTKDRNSAGRNFSYRNYFHGGRDDLQKPASNEQVAQVPPLTETRFSAAFQSTASGLWKVAISTPVYLAKDSDTPDAVFVTTINLGEFPLLQRQQNPLDAKQADSGQLAADNQVAVLVEARQGDQRGTILEHPFLRDRRAAGDATIDKQFKISPSLMDRLIEGGDVDYRDPVASDPEGQAYRGEWIAAMQPIELPNLDVESVATPNATSGEDNAGSNSNAESKSGTQANRSMPDTDLLVLVQYRLSKVFAPVGQMRRSLFIEGAAAMLSVLLVTMVMWYFVWRANNKTQEELSDSVMEHSGLTETIPVQN